MKIDFSTTLKNLDAKELKSDKGKSLTLGDVSSNALLANFKDENINGKEKLRRFKLANKIYGVKEPVSITVEDIALIKELVAKLYSVIISGQVWELLEKEG